MQAVQRSYDIMWSTVTGTHGVLDRADLRKLSELTAHDHRDHRNEGSLFLDDYGVPMAQSIKAGANIDVDHAGDGSITSTLGDGTRDDAFPDAYANKPRWFSGKRASG